MKGMKNVEVAGPGIPAPLKRGSGGARSGSINIVSGQKPESAGKTSQPNTKGGNIVSPTKSK